MDKMQGETVRLDRASNRLLIVDQTRFPNEKVVLELQTLDEMVVAIQTLQVRGAPAIGVAAALGLSSQRYQIVVVCEHCGAVDEFIVNDGREHQIGKLKHSKYQPTEKNIINNGAVN